MRASYCAPIGALTPGITEAINILLLRSTERLVKYVVAVETVAGMSCSKRQHPG